MKRIIFASAATLLIMLLVAPSFATPRTSLQTRSTWDADMINSEDTGYSGKGVYVAVLDTGLAPNWRDYFPAERIADKLGIGFKEDIRWDVKTQMFVETGRVYLTGWIGDQSETHGTHVTSTIIGYNYYAPADAASGFPLTPLFIEGIAPNATIIPVKVLSEYNIGKSQTDPINFPDQRFVMGTDRAVAAGIRYATELKKAGYSPMIITMSLGGPSPASVIEEAINYAIENGVVVVAAAGNEGNTGMSWPGAYPQVISAGACGWRYEWYSPTSSPPPRYRLWWLQDTTYGFRDITEPTPAGDIYIAPWSSRQLSGQQLDVVAPGTWVRGPYPGGLGYNHLPWWSNGLGWLNGRNPGNFFYVGGTSMATPHVTSVAAQMLEKDPTLEQGDVESILKSTALAIAPGSMTVYDLNPTEGFYTYSWGSNAAGAGLILADKAVDAVQ